MTGKQATVLIVDDEPGMRDMLSFELSQEGYDVETADSGPGAIDAMKRRRFDLAITDLKMPGMDGVETVASLRTIDPDIEVIVGTGYGTIETAVASMKRGAYDYIEKPYDLERLTKLLERAMEKSHLQGVVALYEASQALFTTPKHDDLPSLVTDLARRVLRTEVIGLLLGPEPASADVHTAGRDQPPSSKLLRELAQWSNRTGGPMRLPTPVQGLPDAAARGGFASALVYPIVARERTFGHLVTLRIPSQPLYSESELRRGCIFARQVASSLENASLYESLRGKIEELVETREQLIQAEKLAVAARLARSVAHEVQNPLTFMTANLDELSDYSTTIEGLWLAAKSAAQYLRTTRDSAARDLAHDLMTARGRRENIERVVQDIGEVIDDVREGVKRIAELVAGFNRLTQPLDPAAREAFDLCTLVEEVLESFFAAGRSRAHGLRLEANDAPAARAAPADVRTAFLNVLGFLWSRPREIRSSDDVVSIACGSTSGRPTIVIADPTLKLSAEERLRILDPRVDIHHQQGRTMRLDLAMSLAYQLVRRNGGSLTVHRDEDGGTVFRIKLNRVERTEYVGSPDPRG